MLFYFLALFTAAIIVWLNNRKNEANRWAAFFLGSASIGGLSDFLLNFRLTIVSEVLQFLNFTLTPYAVMIFSLSYSGWLTARRSIRPFKLFLSLPIPFMLIPFFFSDNRTLFFSLLLLWSAPYYLSSCYILVASFWSERDIRLKRSRFISMIIIVPTLLAVLFFIYVAKVISPDFEFFNYISVFIIYSLAVALLCTFMYGVLGVRLRFEHDPMESTMRAVSTGTAMLNHTLKNEIGKIAISTENLKSMIPDPDEQSKQHMQIIMNASNHMLEMVGRMHSQMKDISLKEDSVPLADFIEHCLLQHEGLFRSCGVTVNRVFEQHPTFICDKVHFSEALGNVLNNACEAMPGGGEIEIKLAAHPNGVELSIQDSGIGIPKEKLGEVFDPFFSIGKTGSNFGLGLSYVYNVMQKSGVKVRITSEEKKGTQVSFLLPRKKLI